MQRLLDRYMDLQIDFDDWLRKNINHSRDVRVDERDGVKVAKTGVVEIRFKRPFLISRHFVVNKLVFDASDEKEFCVEGGVVFDIVEKIPLSCLTLKEKNALVRELDAVVFDIVEKIPLSCLTLKEKNALVRELDARGYFDDEK